MHNFAMVFVATPTNPVDMTSNLTTLAGMAGSTISTALPYAVGLFAAFVGWKYVRRFIK